MDKERKLLSIVVPVYNAEGYVSNCLDSLIDQNIDASEYDIICVNDGSTDLSLEILYTYAQKYGNIKIIDKPNGGVSSARNEGMREALSSGQYVWFVDADDWIARNCLGLIKQKIEDYNPSVVQVHYDWIKAEWRIKECIDKQLDMNKAHSSVHQHKFLPYDGAWSAIINKEILDRYHHTFREELHYGEDILFVRDLFDTMRIESENNLFTHNIVHLQDEVIYYYRMHNDSAMNTRWTKNRIKYAQALLKLARIDKERMQDKTKPDWYTEQYEKLYGQRMYNYLIYWLPGIEVDIFEHMEQLKNEELIPLPSSVCKDFYQEVKQTEGILQKIKKLFQYLAVKWVWLYPFYFKKMQKRF